MNDGGECQRMNDRLCVIMPVYNEQDAIGSVLEKWAKALDALKIDYAIRPYNDGSKDSSLKVIQAVAAHLPRIEVRDKANGGHGNTILTGYREAAEDGFGWIFQVDSDDEMGPEKFGELWRSRGDYDFLVGIRDGRIQQLPRKVISFVSRLCVRLFYGRSVWDVNTPYRLMRVSSFADFYHAIPLTTFAPNVILSGLAARNRLRSFETRVPQHDRTTGEVSIRKWKLMKAAAKSFYQTVAYAFSSGLPIGWFWLIAGVGLAARLLASRFGSNFDYESYGIVADIVNRGGNVYAETMRYNYGPIWFLTLGALKSVFGSYFRIGIILVLSAADIGIAALLWHWRSPLAAFLLLLSPLSIHISGYHNQFDNLALFVAFAALILADRRRALVLSSLLLGLSLSIKHVFAFFPFWFLLDGSEKMSRRIMRCVIPLLVFLLPFVPYVARDAVTDMRNVRERIVEYAESNPGRPVDVKTAFTIAYDYGKTAVDNHESACMGWLCNVILYRSRPNGLCWQLGIGRLSMPVLVLGIIIGGFLLRKRSLFERGLCYTAILVLFSPALENQYYAIPVAYCAAHLDVFSFLYSYVCDIANVSAFAFTGRWPSAYVWSVLLLAASLVRSARRMGNGRIRGMNDGGGRQRMKG